METRFAQVSCEIVRKVVLTAVIATMFSSQLLAKPSEKATEIHVQIVDSRTHRPLKGHKVQITFSGMDGQFYQNAPRMVGRTGSDGEVVFDINQSIPPLMDVLVWWAYPCSNPEVYSTPAVLEDGVVARWSRTGDRKTDEWCTADPQVPRLQEQPGKVVFFAHPMNRFVWAWYDTWK
jgi:hypothetical protein